MLQKLLQSSLLLMLSAFCALAQFDSAAVLGTIRDASSSPLTNSSVTLRNVQTGVSQNTQTNGDGDYQFFNIKPGTYTVSAEAKGFKTSTAAEFVVVVNARQRVDLNLSVGDVAETVTVSGAAAQLETDTSSKGQVIANAEIVNLPLNGRNYADLALLVPGVRKSDLAYGVPRAMPRST